ncbi:hypothetical protein [Staphylococcus shinii]|uniref:hypothetical protein n=1 Tax=Staphylococcus shinii TaxID=2912228 RepID=UPI003513407A
MNKIVLVRNVDIDNKQDIQKCDSERLRFKRVINLQGKKTYDGSFKSSGNGKYNFEVYYG